MEFFKKIFNKIKSTEKEPLLAEKEPLFTKEAALIRLDGIGRDMLILEKKLEYMKKIHKERGKTYDRYGSDIRSLLGKNNKLEAFINEYQISFSPIIDELKEKIEELTSEEFNKDFGRVENFIKDKEKKIAEFLNPPKN